MNLRLFAANYVRSWLERNSPWIIALLYGDFWNYRKSLSQKKPRKTPKLYTSYLNRYNAFIGKNALFKGIPTLPHGLSGIFISNSAKIGKNVVIYHHVTIGSNTLKSSKTYGAPTIEDGVMIGAGAKIIGNVNIGKNSRIGAGCVVTESVPQNSVVGYASLQNYPKRFSFQQVCQQ